MSADNTICDGHQHIRREGRFIPVVMVYGKTLRTGLHVRCPPVGTNILSFQDARWPAADGHLTNS
ncbi:hypothetical protein DYJ25_01920 [Prevotella denticola]|nr:hypothetical protein DYJ25_01920 [Prevotella denticola]